MKFFIYLSPFIFLLLLAVTVIVTTSVCGSTVMHAIMIPYDMIYTYMYAQELVHFAALSKV